MEQIVRIEEWRAIQKQYKVTTIGLVPTMGYLHEGHLSLVKKAKQDAEMVVLSIFVNPLQFGANEDYSTYPRDLERDAQLAQKAGVDYLFTPSVEEMYPSPPLTRVHVDQITEGLCGASRPGHFDGVATVVLKLFQIIQPNYAYFGIKDAQQVAVIQKMVDDLNSPVQIVPCPTLREEDGLALSSRNVRLTERERKEAPILYQSLSWAREEINRGEQDAQLLIQGIKERIGQSPLADIDYIEIRTFPGLERVEQLRGKLIIAAAVRFGTTRLIDNMIAQPGGEDHV